VAAPAAPQQRRVASSYDAPAGCPTQGDYVQYVESRSERLRLFAEPAAVQTSGRVSVRIQPDTGTNEWIGALTIEGEAPLERQVRGARCEDVVLALALITVLRLEPNRQADAPASTAPGAAGLAATGATSTGATSTAATPTATGEGERASATPTPATANPSPEEPAAGSASESASASPTATPDAAAASPWLPAPPEATPTEPSARTPLETLPEAQGSPQAVAGAAASQSGGSDAIESNPHPERSIGASAGVSDSPPLEVSHGPPLLVEPGLAAYVGYASSPSHAFNAMLRGQARFRPGVEAWAAAVSLSYGHSSQQNPSVDLDFDSLLAGLAVCPPGLRLSLGIWLQACGEARGGVLAISVIERELPIETSSTPRPWFELGPSVQVGLPLSSRWSLRALSSVALVLMRDSFGVERVVVDEDGQEQKEFFTLYRPPVASFQLLLGFGYEF